MKCKSRVQALDIWIFKILQPQNSIATQLTDWNSVHGLLAKPNYELKVQNHNNLVIFS
jgi:hypothetical protein